MFGKANAHRPEGRHALTFHSRFSIVVDMFGKANAHRPESLHVI